MTHTATANGSCMRSRGRWNAFNIVLMILGFVVFWPLGLGMLAWIIWGDELGRMFRDAKAQFSSATDRASFRAPNFGGATMGRTGNVAFDDYRAAELKRLDDERRKIDEMKAEFDGFVRELRRVKDQDEFSRFMADYETRISKSESAEDVIVDVKAAKKSGGKGSKKS